MNTRLAASLAMLPLACTRPLAQVLVIVDADAQLREALADDARVRVVVRGDDGRGGEAALRADRELTSTTGLTWPFSFGLTPIDRDPTRRYTVTVEVFAEAGLGPILTRTVTSGYVTGETRELRLRLTDSCQSFRTSCDVDETCDDGRCVPVEIDPRSLPRVGEDAPRLVDAGPATDAGPCACGRREVCNADLECVCAEGTLERAGRCLGLDETTVMAGTGVQNAFGTSVALSADAQTMVVGAPGANGFAGRVEIFHLVGGTWVRRAAFDGTRIDGLGTSVAISGDGRVAFAGAPNLDVEGSASGRLERYVRVGNTWQANELPQPAGLGPHDSFGISVATSYDGSVVVAGASDEDASGALPGENEDEPGSGAVFVFQAGVWHGWKTPSPSSGARFGESVSITGDGTTWASAAVGESCAPDGFPCDGAVYVLQRGALARLPGVDRQMLGGHVRLSPDGAWLVAAAPDANEARGALRTYRREESGYVFVSAIDATPYAAMGNRFATSVALCDDALYVGSPFDTNLNGDIGPSQPRFGAIHVFAVTRDAVTPAFRVRSLGARSVDTPAGLAVGCAPGTFVLGLPGANLVETYR